VFFICVFDLFLFSLILRKQLIFTTIGIKSRLVETMAINASIATVGLVKFDGTGNFGLWQRRVKDLLVQQSLVKALYGKTKKPEKMTDEEWEELDMKAVSTIRLLLADEVIYDVMEENSTAGIWLNLEKRYMSKSLTNKLHL
jgi:hypothetical protein